MELSKEELITIFEALEVYGGAHELMDAVAIELEKLELEEELKGRNSLFVVTSNG